MNATYTASEINQASHPYPRRIVTLYSRTSHSIA